MAVIERNVSLQAKLIEDLLDMSRIEQGKVCLDLQQIDLVTIINSSLDSVRPAAENKGIRILSSFSDVSGIFMGDKTRLHQIIWNLLTNAVKFTARGGKVQVVVARVNSHVEVSISDTGEGISPEFLPHVFDRFLQADSSITRKSGGLGLGLSIAKHLTELHGGKLSVASLGLGHGAIFTLDLPLIAVHPNGFRDNEHSAGALGKATLAGVKVLAVDDDVDTIDVIGRILRAGGADVETASSMQEALAEYDRVRPHVILSDVGMPLHDGYEFIAKIRSSSGGGAVPVIALTALARDEDRNRALHSGFQMHLAKPVDARELIAAVKNLASLRFQLDGEVLKK